MVTPKNHLNIMDLNATDAAAIVVSSGSMDNAVDVDGSTISMDDLYPALVQCFGIIICG